MFFHCTNFFNGNFYNQVEIINDLPADKTITVYRCGPLVDLCRGPHIPNTSFAKAFACMKVTRYVISSKLCFGDISIHVNHHFLVYS